MRQSNPQSECPRFYGKYRGKVERNIDPLLLGRLQVSCPAVFGEGSLSWALPCAPFAGPGVGLFALPPAGANVWVEFEGGDPNYPIWSGCFWDSLQRPPALMAIEQMKVFKTDGITLTFSSLPGIGGFTLEVGPPVVPLPMKLSLGPMGIELSQTPWSVKVTPAGVSVNDGALEVT